MIIKIQHFVAGYLDRNAKEGYRLCAMAGYLLFRPYYKS